MAPNIWYLKESIMGVISWGNMPILKLGDLLHKEVSLNGQGHEENTEAM